jgi:VCBS repeat-containing protein
MSGALLTVQADGSYSYDPNGRFEHLGSADTAVDTFTYSVEDDSGGSSTATVTLTITGENDPPLAREDFATTANNTPITLNVLENDVDLDTDLLRVTLLDAPAVGSATVNDDGTITYVPPTGFVGTIRIRYQVEDPSGATSAALLTIEVTPSFTFDSFNNFSVAHGKSQMELGGTPVPTPRILTQEISGLAPEPIFSGSARPGTLVLGQVYNSAGILIGETTSYADVGGNWMMQFHELQSTDHARIEFQEIAGTSGRFEPIGDLYGYLGVDAENNDYAALEPWTPYEEAYDFSAVYRGTAANALAQMHRLNQTPLGFGNP